MTHKVYIFLDKLIPLCSGYRQQRSLHGGVQRTSVIQLQNLLALERPLRPHSPTVNPALLTPPLKHIHKYYIYSTPPGMGTPLLNFPGQPVQCLTTLAVNIRSKSLLLQLEAISLSSSSVDCGRESGNMKSPKLKLWCENLSFIFKRNVKTAQRLWISVMIAL